MPQDEKTGLKVDYVGLSSCRVHMMSMTMVCLVFNDIIYPFATDTHNKGYGSDQNKQKSV